MTAWMTSEWCSTWHVVDRGACGRIVVATCGHPLTGRLSRVLRGPLPADSRQVCQACVALVGARAADSTQAAVFATALGALTDRRSLTPPSSESERTVRPIYSDQQSVHSETVLSERTVCPIYSDEQSVHSEAVLVAALS
ncbi:hypothetical protein INP57_03790 [Saccharopolyspora sp. HNM0986]|uniref:hypothetical protein n=1 Tax=Saccharopolyspora galaxeae TaxID=2781241 RepID=UPI00190DB23C|nr:hypothetical protein [Saccharopolyspora sp. HNM0986]MBK0865920.1 hypothetical protein [Saccharopolyspora sp. HNM0986]